jgi:hypothetical protein
MGEGVEEDVVLRVELNFGNLMSNYPLVRISEEARRRQRQGPDKLVTADRAGAVLASVDQHLLWLCQVEGRECDSPV